MGPMTPLRMVPIQRYRQASEIRDEIAEHIREGSRLIVVESANEAAWRNVICRNEWLKEHI